MKIRDESVQSLLQFQQQIWQQSSGRTVFINLVTETSNRYITGCVGRVSQATMCWNIFHDLEAPEGNKSPLSGGKLWIRFIRFRHHEGRKTPSVRKKKGFCKNRSDFPKTVLKTVNCAVCRRLNKSGEACFYSFC